MTAAPLDVFKCKRGHETKIAHVPNPHRPDGIPCGFSGCPEWAEFEREEEMA